jgi:hypothetical protein
VTVCCAISITHPNSMELYVAMILTNNMHEFGSNHPPGLQECTHMLLSEYLGGVAHFVYECSVYM